MVNVLWDLTLNAMDDVLSLKSEMAPFPPSKVWIWKVHWNGLNFIFRRNVTINLGYLFTQ